MRAAEREWQPEDVYGLRYHLGASQQELARLLGVRQQTVSDWETGLHAPQGASRRLLSMVAEQRGEYDAKGRRHVSRGPLPMSTEQPAEYNAQRKQGGHDAP